MTAWSAPKRSQIAQEYAREAAEARKLADAAQAVTPERANTQLRALLSAYVGGTSSCADHLQHHIRQLIDRAGARTGFLPAAGSFFEKPGTVKANLLAFLCPDLVPALYAVRDNADLEQIPLLEPCPNELVDNNLPPPMNRRLHRPTRPAMWAYATRDAVVYADPFRYQVLSRDQTALWSSGGPRGLSRAAIGRPEPVSVAGDIVVLQDRFSFSNFAHLLFDGITRALLLAQPLGALRSSLLVFGGVPGAYQAAVCKALCRVLELDDRNIYFPDRPVLLQGAGRSIWFSDQVDTTLHPAQMAHPTSIGLLRSVIEALPGEATQSKRVYVSRSDAGARRLINEAEVATALAGRGFATVQLSKLSIPQQIGLFRQAEAIVAPHGMGLTHLGAADRLNGVVELHSPDTGTDAYAFIAKAGGIDYSWVIGAASDGPAADFKVDLNRVIRCVDAIGVGTAPRSWRKAANLIPGSRSFSNFRAQEACDEAPVPPMVWGSSVAAHRAAENQRESGAVVGACNAIQVIPGASYAASCWVWVPDKFTGTGAFLSLSGASEPLAVAADLDRRQQWQRISVVAVTAAQRCDVELRLVAPPGCQLFSTCWQLERGGEPTGYVPTG